LSGLEFIFSGTLWKKVGKSGAKLWINKAYGQSKSSKVVKAKQ